MDAAGLKRLHQLEGAPDPFPSLDSAPVPRPSPQTRSLDTESHEAFPSLAPAASANKPSASAWSNATGPRIKPAVAHSSQATESFTLGAIELSPSGRDGKTPTLGEIMKQVMTKFKVKIEASTNQKTRQTTFQLKADSKKDLEKSKRSLVALLSPVVTLTIDAPASTIASIIGPKGATLKQIRDQTTVRIDIPRRDALNGNGAANGSSHPTSGVATPVPNDDEEEPTVPVTVNGPQPLALEAQEFIKQIIASKTSKTTQRVRDIPAHVVPFVKASRGAFVEAAQGGEIQLTLNSAEREVSISGDREAVIRAIEAVKATVESYSTGLTSVKITLPKRQHRLLVGPAVNEIVASSKCSVSVPSPDDSSEEVTVWGKPDDLANGLAAVMNKANSQYIHEFPLPGPVALSRQILTYITRIGYTKTLTAAHPGVTVFTPTLKDKATVLNVDIVGDKPAVDAAVRQFSELIGKLIGATKDVNVDWLVHKIIQGKNAKKIKSFHENNNVLLFFPPESDELSSILLVYDPTSPSASPSPVEKAKNIEDVQKELLKFAKDAADVKSQTIEIPKKWHDAVIGKNRTTLNAIIGEEKTLSIKFGAEVDVSNEDLILVRGASSEVDRAIKEIQDIVENAKNDQILSSYTVDFEIDREYVGRIVGSQGSGVNKLRDQLGVHLDFLDDNDDGGMKDVGKKKKPGHQKTKVHIVGRKENVEEAKRRVLTQVERLADETLEVLKIPSQYHSGLIGQSGKYVIRLEDKYGVKITFPRESADNGEGKTREQLKSDEVLVKGGRKGVAQAKSELMDAVDFEKESNNVIKFTVAARAIPRILGKGGATINEIKDDTGAQIDLDKTSEDSGSAQITCRGTKKAINAAKAAIQAIADQVGEEVNVTLKIENRYHRTLIGAGGQGLKALITRCDGPSDSKAQAGLVRFPRQGEEPNDEVRLRGDPVVVAKLKAELEKVVGELRDRVVFGVDIPASNHSALIGRGGRNLTEFQTKYGVQVQYPGSNSYGSAGALDNAADLKDVDPASLVKVIGARASVEKAVEYLKTQIKAAPAEVIGSFTVPFKYYHAVTQQNAIFRTIRSFGVQADVSAHPQKPAVPTRPENGTVPTARIDDADEAPIEVQWQIVPNHQEAEEGESIWTLKARDEAGLEKAKNTLQQALERAEAMSHVGFLTLPDRNSFPRIVGSKGSNIARLHAETGADITVSRENSTIVLQGSESAIEVAKEAILKIASDRETGRGRRN
ncbi:SCP160 protein [Auriscalpium vulgare]|uniref:SCP160 protein n=1 Tax=Auriscalpium vulgare TaxID=40419 RepID=A0ACB8S709_9AGAM|nr:SCP160 protein [Auriscalpium vulgare]